MKNPRTGGEYVLASMYRAFIESSRNVKSYSLHDIFMKETREENNFMKISKSLLIFIYSLLMYKNKLIITGSSPMFPVFGHITYHQPRGGLFTEGRNLGDHLDKLNLFFLENERLNPIWRLVKRNIILHLSNSFFTKNRIDKLLKIDSRVLYPPVPVQKYIDINIKGERRRIVLVSKPNGVSGINRLIEVSEKLPRNIKIIIFGYLDSHGLGVLRQLKKTGVNYNYLGYVPFKLKKKLFSEASVFLNLVREESFGITALECMASGCIPILHNSGAVTEYTPKSLLYSEKHEASELITKYMDEEKELRNSLRQTSLKFDETIFKKKILKIAEETERRFFPHKLSP